jgi:hypothetical protein
VSDGALGTDPGFRLNDDPPSHPRRCGDGFVPQRRMGRCLTHNRETHNRDSHPLCCPEMGGCPLVPPRA